jgi:hypothetical protein
VRVPQRPGEIGVTEDAGETAVPRAGWTAPRTRWRGSRTGESPGPTARTGVRTGRGGSSMGSRMVAMVRETRRRRVPCSPGNG